MQNRGIVSCRRDEDPAYIRDMLSASPDQLALLKQNNPRLAEAHQSGSLEQFAKVGSVRLVIDKERKGRGAEIPSSEGGGPGGH